MEKLKKILFFLLLIFSLYFGLLDASAKEITTEQPKIEKVETDHSYYYLMEDKENKLNYSWKFQKQPNQKLPLSESLKLQNDLKISIDADNSATQNIHRLVKKDTIVISLNRFGESPEWVTVELDVTKKFKEGEKLYLYSYQEQEDTIEFVENEIEVSNGKSKFTVTECTDYFLTNQRIKNAQNNPRKINATIIVLVIISFLLLSITFLEVRKK